MAASHLRSAIRLIVTIMLAAAAGPVTTSAQRPRPAPATKAARPLTAAPIPPLPPPLISVAGIRVVGPGLGANGSELHAFSAAPGTTIALAIRPPAGAGIVEIDDRASRLDAVRDDQGRNLLEEGRFGPFPKVSEDGSAGLAEFEVKGHPSPGTAAIHASGALAVTLAGGSKPQRISGVRIEAGRAMKLGAAPVTLQAVTAGDESTSVTFGLARSVLRTIREVRFFDATGEPIESRQTGSGYINEAATLDLDVKTTQAVVAIEFEVWQNLQQTKTPFEITTGLGLPGAAAVETAGPAGNEPPIVVPPGPVRSADARRPSGAHQTAPAATDGAGSPAAVMKQIQTATAAGKTRDVLAVVYPDDRANFARTIAMLMPLTVMGHLDDQKAADKIQKDVDALFAKYKITAALVSDPAEIFKGVDLAAFLADAIVFLKGQLPKAEDFAGALPLLAGAVQDLKVTGDSAAAKIGDDAITFSRVNGKWFLRVPATRESK